MKRRGKIAYDVFQGRSPDISYFHVFGKDIDHLEKFDEKADDSLFLRYSLVANAFRVFNIRRQEMEETYHVTFNKVDEVITHTSIEADEHPVHNESDEFKPAENLDNISEAHNISDDVNLANAAEPITTLISP
ncbi:hypothetical protein Tco_0960140 [Tanacetum coccineum]